MTRGYFGSLLTAMVTPMKDDLKVDFDAAAKLAEYLIENGSDGLVISGTTGESPTLTEDEKLDLFKLAAETAKGKAKVIAGTGSNDTIKTISLTRKAAKLGIDGIMLVGPYYNKPPQRGLYDHFHQIASAVDLPVILYNVPGRTGSNIEPATVVKLAETENIVALKEASGNLAQISELCRLLPSKFTVYSGDDNMTLPIMSVGGKGVISVASHLIGKEMKTMINAYLQGDTRTATDLFLQLLPVFRAIFLTANPIPVKTALNMIGHKVGGFRPPLCQMSDDETEQLRRILITAGLL